MFICRGGDAVPLPSMALETFEIPTSPPVRLGLDVTRVERTLLVWSGHSCRLRSTITKPADTSVRSTREPRLLQFGLKYLF